MGPASCTPATGADGRVVLHQRQQIGTRGGGHRYADRCEYLRQQGIQEEAGELAVVPRIVHAEAILGTGPIISSLISGLPSRCT